MATTRDQAAQLRILIIEDVEDDALLLVDQLISGGFEFDWQYVDTEISLSAALSRPWNIVLSDYSMPTFSGARALQIVREHDPDLPFIIVSGAIGELAAVEAIRAGANDYVMKDNLARLLPTVDRELRDSRLRRERRESEQMLRKLSLVVKQTTDSVFITDPQGHIEYVNPAFERLTGYAAEEVSTSKPDILHFNRQQDGFRPEIWRTLSRGEVYRGTLVNRRKDGGLFYEETVIAPLKDEHHRTTHFVSTGRDISLRVQAEQDRTRLAAILEATPDLVAILDPGGGLRYLNRSGRELLGLQSQDTIEARSLKDLFPERVAQRLLGEIMPALRCDNWWTGESTLRVAGGGELPVSLVVLAHRDSDGHIEYLSTTARDISERKHFEAELEHRATHDSLTDLPNRYFLIDRFNSALERARRHGTCVAVLFLDLNNFKRVNDSLGHAAGDTLLQQVALRLKSCLRPNDSVARHGGDEFTIIVDDLGRAESALTVLGKLNTLFETPVDVGSEEVYVTFSTGIALYPHDGDTVDDLLRYADTAMYRAKSSGSCQYRFYSPEMNARGHEFLRMEADLGRALELGEFRLYGQPQVEVRSGRLACVEALIRWQHPARGLVSPTDFIPLLENSGMIIAVGEWVLRQACAQHRQWRGAGFDTQRIAVNVSAAQFSDDGFLDKVRRTLHEERMPAQRLELEITENIVMQDPDGASEVLRDLHALGVRTAIDDFGTGYSSLAYLKRFPLDVLKIDRTFVADLDRDPGDAVIVEASISLAHKLGLEIVAEGVESRQQLDFLRDHRCDLAQGFCLSRPLPGEALQELLPKVWG